MLKRTEGYYKITEIFIDKHSKQHVHVRNHYSEQQCFDLVAEFQQIGYEIVKDSQGHVLNDNGFYMKRSTPLGDTAVHIQYIGQWEEV